MLTGILINLLWIVAYIVIAAIVVFAIIYVAQALGFPLPATIQKLLWALVAILALIMLVQLLFGIPPFALRRI